LAPREKAELDIERRKLEDRMMECKDVLPVAEQLLQLQIDFDQFLAFHSALHECKKRIPGV
jgi:hypothetical protein